jgi:hypothetical protein
MKLSKIFLDGLSSVTPEVNIIGCIRDNGARKEMR